MLSYSGLRRFELTVTPRDKRLSLACPRAGVHVQLTTTYDGRFSIGETKWGHQHCAKNSQDRCATDIQTIKELAVPGTSIQVGIYTPGRFHRISATTRSGADGCQGMLRKRTKIKGGRSLPVELLSNFGRITPKRGTTSAPATINSVATRKRPRPANRRYATNRILSWRATICNTLARWRGLPPNSDLILSILIVDCGLRTADWPKKKMGH